ncbi:MAG: hypothetical protein WC495_06910 [Patescibacteria group bacterium]|jgi:hypothetical protein
MQGEGFWSNQKAIKNPEDIQEVVKNTIILNTNHINAVVVNLEDEDGYFPFPITRKEYAAAFDYFHERYGLEGKAREIILLILTCGYDYIRFRVNLGRQNETIIFGTGQVNAKTMLIARTLFKWLNSPRNKIIKDEHGKSQTIKGSQGLDDKQLVFQSYQKLLDSNYSKKEKEALYKAVPKRHKDKMKKILGIGKAESSYAKAKADIDYALETSPKAKSIYIPSPERQEISQETGKWVYNVGEMLKKYGLTLVDIKEFATEDEYKILKEYFQKD